MILSSGPVSLLEREGFFMPYIDIQAQVNYRKPIENESWLPKS
jgi:hypothetical protein